MFDLTVMTIIVYILANGFTYVLGTTTCAQPPLKDVMHDILPNWSHIVHVRDIVLLLFFVPVLGLAHKWLYIKEVWECFILLVLVKAVCIFFTYIPSSNPNCIEKNYLNHCHHNSTSGHAGLCMLLVTYYIRHGLCTTNAYIAVFLYCILIAMTRAHYTVDILQGVIISYLISV